MMRHVGRALVAAMLVLGVVGAGESPAPAAPATPRAPELQATPPSFQLPLMQGEAADTSITWYDPDGSGSTPGYYVMIYNKTGNYGAGITARKAASIADLRYAPDQIIYRSSDDPTHHPAYMSFGIGYGSTMTTKPYNGHWYIYSQGEDGPGPHHDRTFVLESAGLDPMGPYHFQAELPPTGRLNNGQPDPYAYGAIPLEINGELYVTETNGANNVWQILIAKLANPWTLEDPVNGWKVLTQAGQNPWECPSDGSPCGNEGASFVTHGGKMHITFAADTWYSPDYCTGMLTAAITADPLVQSNWTKSTDCVFKRNDNAGVYGPFGNFFKSPDGTEDWFLYFYRTSPNMGAAVCCRVAGAKKITWDANDMPVFGQPAAGDTNVTSPSGDPATLDPSVIRYEAEAGTVAGGATVTGSTFASGGSYVSSLSTGRSVSWSIGTYWARGHKMYLHYSNPGSAAKVNVRIDGGPPTAVSLPSTGASSGGRFPTDRYAVLDMYIPLDMHTISIEGATGSVNIDKLVVDYRVVAESPAMASHATNSLDLFAAKPDGSVWTSVTNNGGTNWSPWAAPGTGTPTSGARFGLGAVSRKADWLDLFAVGRDGTLYSKWWGWSAWQSWFSLGAPAPGIAGSGVSAVGRTVNDLDLFVLGTDSKVWTRSWHEPADGGAGWSAWSNLGAPPYGAIGAPTAVTRDASRMDLFVVGSDLTVWTKWWAPVNGVPKWSDWVSLGAPLGGGAVSVVGGAWDPWHIDLVVQGSDGAFWTRGWYVWTGWSPWTKVTGSDTFNSDRRGLAATSRRTETARIDLAARRPAPDETFGWTTLTNTGWSPWTPVGAP